MAPASNLQARINRMKALLILLLTFPAYATSHLQETRYADHIERDGYGKIKRSVTVIKEFERLYPLPAGYDRKDWQIDHVIPLARCGADAVHNMQWLPKTIKTCADDSCKDRWERAGIYPKKC